MAHSNQPTVEVNNVSKSYGELKAVDNLSFTAYRGEIFGLLGPNGAGKTTTLEMIEGLRQPDQQPLPKGRYYFQLKIAEVLSDIKSIEIA